MKIDVLTLFPEMFSNIINESILKRAIDNKLVEINIHNIRDYSKDPHKRVDDYAFGGGKGMVLKIEPIYDAINNLKTKESVIIMMTPQGKTYNQKLAYNLSKKKHLIIICGHYEGFDERIRSLVDMEISIGDFVLTGGEIPSLVLIDSITRLIDGVIIEESHLKDSFNDNLLDYPTYTHPVDFMGMKVPDVLLSGHHKNINKWRREQSLLNTYNKRPELLKEANLTEEDKKFIEELSNKK